MTQTYFRNFAIMGAAVLWMGAALDMIASSMVPPATARQCASNPLWCFYSNHPAFGLLGVLMCVAALAAFATLFSHR